MRVTCPSCDAVYDVPDHLLGGSGRRMRCTRCRHEWRAGADAPPPEPPPPIAAPKPPAPRIAVPQVDPAPERLRRPQRSGRAEAAFAILLSIAALVAGGLAAVSYRAELMHLWPPSQRLFTWLGLAS